MVISYKLSCGHSFNLMFDEDTVWKIRQSELPTIRKKFICPVCQERVDLLALAWDTAGMELVLTRVGGKSWDTGMEICYRPWEGFFWKPSEYILEHDPHCFLIDMHDEFYDSVEEAIRSAIDAMVKWENYYREEGENGRV